jgi:amidase
MDMSALTLSRLIRQRRVSCVEVMAASLARVERRNGPVNAIVALRDPQELLREARNCDDDLSAGRARGALHGLPHAVKDLQAVRGMVSSSGSPILATFVPTADSLPVARLRQAGAIFIGKTNTPEFGLGSNTYNPVYGVTRNPYDLSRSAGGSSGGAAVALALRMTPLADGSDVGGSLRNPAGWNNVLGFRPSIGRVPTDEADAWLPSMGVVGPMARDVGDLALLLSVMAGWDPRAPLSADKSLDFGPAGARSARGARIGWLGDFAGAAVTEPEVLSVCQNALKVFESLGCTVETATVASDPEAAWQAFQTLRAWKTGAKLLPYYADPTSRPLLKPEAVFEVEAGLRLTAYELEAASVARTTWSRAISDLFETFDYLLAPTAQVFPFEASEPWPRQIEGQSMRTYHEWMKGACLVSLSGCPSLAMPAGFSRAGLPMGLQIIAAVREEGRCLQLAAAYEAASKWTALHPPNPPR